MTPREKAQSGLKLLKEATRDYIAAHPEGIRSRKVREDLGLNSEDIHGEHKHYLFWGLWHLLQSDGGVRKERIGRHNVMFLASPGGSASRPEAKS